MTRGVKIRIVIFIVLSAVGITYIAANYLGLVDRVLGRGITVHATLPTSGGLFEGSEVTYRGVKIGKVDRMSTTRDGVKLDLALKELGQTGIPVRTDQALNERDYGDLSGLNKDDARKKWGEEQVHVWRRSYDVPPPGGESLKDTLARTLPYYVQEILPGVLRGERTLVVAHGNSLRALIMVLEKLTPEGILARELATGVPVIYRLNADATVASKLDLAA